MRALVLSLVVACTTTAKPTPTGASCPDVNNPQYTWQNFGYDFFRHYCTNCHDSSLTLNQRNGAPPKTLITEHGKIQINAPRDRDGSFEPKIVKKRQRYLIRNLETVSGRELRSARRLHCRLILPIRG